MPTAVAAPGPYVDSATRPNRPDPELARLRTWATALDRFVDPVLGLLVPGLGDALGTVLGLGLVTSAVRRKLPAVVIARMLLNLAIDAIFGAIPLLGDVFDFINQANKKNLELLLARHDTRRSTARDWAIVGVAILVLLAAVGGALFLTYKVAAWACNAL